MNGVWFVLDSPDRLFVTIDGVERSRPDGSWVTTLLIVPVSDRLFVTVDGVRYCSLDCMWATVPGTIVVLVHRTSATGCAYWNCDCTVQLLTTVTECGVDRKLLTVTHGENHQRQQYCPKTLISLCCESETIKQKKSCNCSFCSTSVAFEALADTLITYKTSANNHISWSECGVEWSWILCMSLMGTEWHMATVPCSFTYLKRKTWQTKRQARKGLRDSWN